MILMKSKPYIIAKYTDEGGYPTWINYYPGPNSMGVETVISVNHGSNRSYPQGPCLEPEKMLEWAPSIFHDKPVNGKLWEPGPPGWFRRQCEAAGCLWFYGMVERMAAGQEVPIEEIKVAHRENNGGKELEQKAVYELI
jgi:hypothetical protein